MYSSSSGPRSKSATHGAGTSPAIRDAATNGNARAAYPGTYSNLNAYTAPTVVASTASSRSTTQSARLRPTPRPPLEQRDSILRASILDTALELGVGTSSAVDKWMFGPIGEADEETDEVR
ncbi:uncharacterized protein PHACADRAFT_263378 [Phanerochaete carnosa HHB-10118-sp]|uniref:Uncharacterized protein n=1 Tax=Phanerochaete carnosa (strain HHB-10118-sp) TaxID=650164 RepID=K5VX32_PHACS|nr:uncharacterized protein PHACADRAFT_263378 [Phanerochaete carnosa HHB-10118-sp]EKM51335.1 hypothetical protein PHACADRAFT_263378 [Phanerochaete carnosa HHB-10118-sp]